MANIAPISHQHIGKTILLQCNGVLAAT